MRESNRLQKLNKVQSPQRSPQKSPVRNIMHSGIGMSQARPWQGNRPNSRAGRPDSGMRSNSGARFSDHKIAQKQIGGDESSMMEMSNMSDTPR